MKKKATILIYLIAFLAWSPWAMAVFNRSKPASSTSMRNSNPEILANWSGLEDGIDREHSFSTGGTVAAQGEHTPGSGKAFSQASAPATQVDGGAFAATDLGSLWVDTDDNAFYVLTATTPTWTPVSTEVIAILLASNRVFAGTLGVTGDFDVNTNKFTVAAATGNTTVAGTFDATGATELIGIATIADASITKTTAAPTTDAMIANKKYVDDTDTPAILRTKAWSKSTTSTINAGSGVTSVTRDSTGVFTVVWDTVFTSVDYLILLGTRVSGASTANAFVTTQSVGGCTIHVLNSSGSVTDPTNLYIEAKGTQ